MKKEEKKKRKQNEPICSVLVPRNLPSYSFVN